jgi:hypothetical protein
MTVEDIKEAIAHLSDEERKQLADWFDDLEEEAWDRQMEQDFAPGGSGAHLLEKIDRSCRILGSRRSFNARSLKRASSSFAIAVVSR